MMNSTTLAPLWQWLIQATFQASVVIVLVLFIQRALRRFLSPRWGYFLWLLVVARLVLPVGPESPISVFNLTPSLSAGIDEPPISLPSIAAQVSPVRAINAPSKEAGMDWKAWFIFVWLGGVVFLSAKTIASYFIARFRWRGMKPIPCSKVHDALSNTCKTMGVHKPPTIHEVKGLFSPSLIGIFRPKLLLPQDLRHHLEKQDLELIFRHELAHLKRNDLLVNGILSLFRNLHWFNPLIWLAYWRCRMDQELACDEVVIAKMNGSERKNYGLTILKVLEQMARPRALPGAVSLLTEKKEIERRINMISNYKKKPVFTALVGCLVFLGLGAVALSGPTQVAAHDPGKKDCQGCESHTTIEIHNGHHLKVHESHPVPHREKAHNSHLHEVISHLLQKLHQSHGHEPKAHPPHESKANPENVQKMREHYDHFLRSKELHLHDLYRELSKKKDFLLHEQPGQKTNKGPTDLYRHLLEQARDYKSFYKGQNDGTTSEMHQRLLETLKRVQDQQEIHTDHEKDNHKKDLSTLHRHLLESIERQSSDSKKTHDFYRGLLEKVHPEGKTQGKEKEKGKNLLMKKRKPEVI